MRMRPADDGDDDDDTDAEADDAEDDADNDDDDAPVVPFPATRAAKASRPCSKSNNSKDALPCSLSPTTDTTSSRASYSPIMIFWWY